MKIFDRSFQYEDKDKINRALTGRRLEPRAVPPKHSGIATDPIDKVIVILVQY
jgi:hypothetical protein